MKEQGLIDRICGNCIEVGECLEWQGAPNPNGVMSVSWKGEKLNVRRVLYEHLHGEVPKTRQVCCTCGNSRCVRHIEALTISQKNRRIAKSGKFSTIAIRAKISATMARTSKLSDEAVREIRYWDGKVTEIAKRHGISEAYAHMLRSGKFRKEYNSPFAGLMA